MVQTVFDRFWLLLPAFACFGLLWSAFVYGCFCLFLQFSPSRNHWPFRPLGNLITLGIFTRKDLQSTFHTNLCVLAVFDLGYITVALLDSILRIFDTKGILNGSYSDPQSVPNTVWIHLFPYFLWPVSNIFMNSATYMTMAIAIDR